MSVANGSKRIRVLVVEDSPVVRELRAEAARARTVIPEYAAYIERVLATGRSCPNGYSTPVLGVRDHCFANAQSLARDLGYRYVEGLATEPARPDCPAGWIEHAWCLDPDGQVVESTWEHWAPRRYFGAVTALPPAHLARVSPVWRHVPDHVLRRARAQAALYSKLAVGGF